MPTALGVTRHPDQQRNVQAISLPDHAKNPDNRRRQGTASSRVATARSCEGKAARAIVRYRAKLEGIDSVSARKWLM